MPVGLLRACACALIALCAGNLSVAYGQTVLLNEDHTIATADEFVPAEHTFDVTVAGTYQVTLTDLGAALTPSVPLASVQLAITTNGAIVGTPLTMAGSGQFTAAVGTYTVHVVGTLASGVAAGEIGIQITSLPANDVLASFSDQVSLPATATPANENFVDDTFTVQSAGDYVVTLSDLSLPQALTGVTLAIVQEGAQLVTALPAAGSATVSLQSGVNYRIFAIGQADPTANAGLYSAVVAPAGGGAPVYQKSIPVGTVQLIATGSIDTGSYTLSAADLALPTALGQLSAAAVVNGTVAAQVSAATSGAPQTFNASAGPYQVFALAVPAAADGVGSYTVTLSPQSGAPLVAVARAAAGSSSTIVPYSYDTTVTAAGAYTLDLADFAVPVKFQALTAAVVQGGAVLGTPLQAAGSANVTTVAGPATLLVFATPDPTGSLFGIDLTPTGGTTALFETTQGVGQLFTGRQIAVTDAGNYGVTVSDVGFPAKLTSLDVIITRGTSTVGAVYGSGQVVLAATPGKYFVNFIAQPGTANAGTYSVTIASAPVVSLTASAGSVDSGGTVTLTWSSQGATACTASGNWSGSQNLQGSAPSAAITAAATYTLTCSGVGGQAAQSVSVALNPPASKGGGGGSLGWDVLLLLCGVVALRWRVCHPTVTHSA